MCYTPLYLCTNSNTYVFLFRTAFRFGAKTFLLAAPAPRPPNVRSRAGVRRLIPFDELFTGGTVASGVAVVALLLFLLLVLTLETGCAIVVDARLAGIDG